MILSNQRSKSFEKAKKLRFCLSGWDLANSPIMISAETVSMISGGGNVQHKLGAGNSYKFEIACIPKLLSIHKIKYNILTAL